jgi:hypothetical protein
MNRTNQQDLCFLRGPYSGLRETLWYMLQAVQQSQPPDGKEMRLLLYLVQRLLEDDRHGQSEVTRYR